MKGLLRRRPSPSMIVAIVALIVALGGTAIAGGVLNKKKVNKIITNRAPGLSVSHAKTADTATSATSAGNAGKASDADAIGGVAKAGLGAGVVLGSMDDTPAGTFARSAFGPSGPCNTVGLPCVDSVASVPLELRDFTAAGRANILGGDALQISMAIGPAVVPLCTATATACTNSGPIAIPAGTQFILSLNGVLLEGDEEWSYSYRLTPG